jgi:hypothetical protein
LKIAHKPEAMPIQDAISTNRRSHRSRRDSSGSSTSSFVAVLTILRICNGRRCRRRRLRIERNATVGESDLPLFHLACYCARVRFARSRNTFLAISFENAFKSFCYRFPALHFLWVFDGLPWFLSKEESFHLKQCRQCQA